MTRERLAELRALEKAATPGLAQGTYDCCDAGLLRMGNDRDDAMEWSPRHREHFDTKAQFRRSKADVRLLAAARNALVELLDLAEEALAARENRCRRCGSTLKPDGDCPNAMTDTITPIRARPFRVHCIGQYLDDEVCVRYDDAPADDEILPLEMFSPKDRPSIAKGARFIEHERYRDHCGQRSHEIEIVPEANDA